MEKFDSRKHSSFVKGLPFSYFSTPLYLDFRAHLLERNKERIVVWQDTIYLHDFPAIFLPKNKKNWVRCNVACATDEDIQKIKKEKIEIKLEKLIESEYIYLTNNFTDPHQRMGKEIRRFCRNYKYKVLKSYKVDKVEVFYKKWQKQRQRNQAKFIDVEGDRHFIFTLKNLKKYKVKQLYVEVNNKLVGFAWSCKHPRGGWVSLQLKTDYNYSGAAHFLRHSMALEFKEERLFTTGTGCGDDGIRKYKNHLKPHSVKDYYYLFLGDKKL